MHCERIVLVCLVSLDEPVTGPSTRSPAADAVQQSSIAIAELELELELGPAPPGSQYAPLATMMSIIDYISIL